MATTTGKKNTRQTTKKTATKPRQTSRKKQSKPEIDRVWSILMFGIGVLVFSLTYIKGQLVWTAMANIMFGIFGWGTYLLAPAIIYLAILVALGKPFKIRLIQFTIAIIIFCGASLVYSGYNLEGGINFEQQTIQIWTLGTEMHPGGILSVILGWSLLAMFGHPAADIVMGVLVMVLVMLVTNITPVDIFLFIKGHIDNVRQTAMEVAQESIASCEIKLTPPERNLKLKDQIYDYEEAPELKKDSDISEPRARFDIDINPQPVNIEEFKKVNPPPYDVDLPFTRSNNAPLPRDVQVVAPVEKEPALITDLIAHDKLSAACLEIANPNIKISQNQHTVHNINSRTVQPHINAEKPEEEMDEVDQLVKKAIETPKEALTVDTNNQLVMQDNQKHIKYKLPTLSLLTKPAKTNDVGADIEMKKNAQILVNTLDSFGVKTKILDICRGTSVTRYELQPLAGVKISRITSLADDIALNLATAGVRIEAPIPGKPAVGIEVPNANREMVRIRSVFEAPAFENSDAALPIVLGKDISGIVQVTDLTKMPHLLIAGTTGSGKSVCTNCIILSLLYRLTPDQLKIILIDPKVVEFSIYNGIPHLAMPVITEPRKAAGALGSAVAEMEKRYQMFAQHNVRDISGFNKLATKTEDLEKMPYIVIVIDEMADLMMTSGKEVEDYVCRLAQKARAAGMHMIVATQRPSVDVITGLIKANIPSRIALSLSSQIDSRTIIDAGGAEKLLGNGDMLFLPVGANKPLRIQGAFVSDGERERVIEFTKSQGESQYNEEMIQNTERIATQTTNKTEARGGDDSDIPQDEMLKPAIEAVIDAGQASTSMLQRRLRLGYGRAGRLIDEMEHMGIIGPYEGAKPRQVLISRQQWIEMCMTQNVIDEGNQILDY